MTALLFILSLLLPAAAGIPLVLLLCPALNRGWAGRLFAGFAGLGLGVGLATCVSFLSLLVGAAPVVPLVEVGAALLAGIGWLLLFRRRAAQTAPPLPGPPQGTRFELLLAGIAACELLASAASFFLTFLREPHGRWDAWLIWNMHARFLYRGGALWREAFASGLDWSHWDYPLLLPLAVARSWGYLGGETLPVPALVAALFALMTLGLLCSSLGFLRRPGQGYLAAMVLMGTPFFIAMGASQFADIPLAFFILATLTLLMTAARSAPGGTGALILAGLAAGLAAWTKNEGLLFLPVAAAALFGTTARSGGATAAVRRTAAFLAGTIPGLLAVAAFKLGIAPANDLLAGFGWEALAAKLFDADRYWAIARAFFLTGLSFTQGLIDVRVGMHLNPGAVNVILLAAYLLFAGVRIDPPGRAGLVQAGAILAAMLTGYFFVYVMTPLDLDYHLATSLNRLFIQLWPGAIFVVFMIANTPEATTGNGAPTPLPSPVAARAAHGKNPKRT